ncbi:unnamed protein product [Macrosiphum euphorbiae]|uniref:PiggyBac transposable element-derived protein domain-containing protein n=1 Tax=Macrosiphum euphorbiae TaxID=13131 RepID=A0AAV0WUH5_9HEMI|nr:unnamed protein product [Macrosiphum euphorbiae]
MNLNDDIIKQHLIDSHFELSDSDSELNVDDTDNDPVFNNLPLSTSRNQDVREKTPLSTSATTPLRTWRPDDNDIKDYPFNPKSDIIGINPDLFDVLLNGTPLDFFKLIVSDDIIIKIVEEIQNWLGLVLWMGLVEMLEIEMYWSNSTLFSTSLVK